MTKLIKSSLALALVCGMSLSAAGQKFQYSGTGGFDITQTSSPAGFTGTVVEKEWINTSAMVLNPPIEGNPQDYPHVGNLWPMISWGTPQDVNNPPANGKSALGLVPYFSGIVLTPHHDGPYVAEVEADAPVGTYTPGGAITHHNVPVSEDGGLIVSSVVWTIKIWGPTQDVSTPPIWKVTLPFPFGEWETHNAIASDPDEPFTHSGDPGKDADSYCPRAFTGLMSDPWSYSTMGEQWTGDGMNMTTCDDAARYIGDGTPYLAGDFSYGGKSYEVYLTGFYDCEDSAGIYHPLTQCNPVHTFWQPEKQNNTAYVMLSVKEVGGDYQGCTPGYWKLFVKKPDKHVWPAGIDTETLFSDDSAFGCEPPENSSITLGTAIGLGGGGENALLRHAVAAWLNATSGDVNYPISNPDTIVADTCAALLSEDADEIEALKNTYEGYNEGDESEGYCPLN